MEARRCGAGPLDPRGYKRKGLSTDVDRGAAGGDAAADYPPRDGDAGGVGGDRGEDRLHPAGGLQGLHRDLATYYGYGRINGFLVSLNPFFAGGSDFFGSADSILATYRQIKADSDPTVILHPLYPEDGGLFPWAYSFDGDAVFWLREGPPDAWPCIVAAMEFNEAVVPYRETMTGLLSAWVAGDLAIPGFPVDLPGRHRPFDNFESEET